MKNKEKNNDARRVERRRTGRSSGAKRDGYPAMAIARWIIGMLFVVAGLFALLAVVCHLFCWKGDFEALQATKDFVNTHTNTTISNPCGPLGVKIADYLVGRSFGVMGVLLPLLVVIFGAGLLAHRPRVMWRTILMMTIITILGSLTFGLLFGEKWNMFYSGWGGDIGITIARLGLAYVGPIGAGLILLVAWILTAVLLNYNIIYAINSFGGKVVDMGGTIVNAAGGIIHGRGEDTAEDMQDEEANSIEDNSEEVEPQNEVEEVQEDNEEDKSVEDATAEEVSGTTSVLIVNEHTEKRLSAREAEDHPFDPDHTPYYKFPQISCLTDYKSKSVVTDDEINDNRSRIEETLSNFGIPIRDMQATIGPTVTLYEIVQETGVRISRVQSLEKDIAQSLKALGIRIIAPIPGRGTIGIEVPNRNKEIVSMRSALLSERFNAFKGELPVVIGRTIQNENLVFDLAKMPHLLVAGATGQGKSVGLNAIIASLLYRKDPSQLKLVMIDPKSVEFSLYGRLEKHFLAKMASEDEAIVTDPMKAVYTLNALCIEMENRLKRCREASVRNIVEYNDKVRNRKIDETEIMPYIVVVIDEFADLIMTAKEVEKPVMRLAQKARAIGIHLIVATQRPDVKVITGGIKANFPARIAFRVTQMIDSRTIIDQPGANQLIGRGDMLLMQDGELTRVQCALIDTPEVERIVDYIASQPSPMGCAYNLPDYEEAGNAPVDVMGSEGEPAMRFDPLFADIAREAVASGRISVSYIQGNYEVGFNRAGRIMRQLERSGIVGPQVGVKPRDIRFTDTQSLEAKLQELGVI